MENNVQMEYCSYRYRNFHCIMTYENLPKDVHKEEFRHKTDNVLMDWETHCVPFHSVGIPMGKIYSLDSNFSIRIFQDSTVCLLGVAMGKTTQVGRYDISLRQLWAKQQKHRHGSGKYLENDEFTETVVAKSSDGYYETHIKLGFRFIVHRLYNELAQDIDESSSFSFPDDDKKYSANRGQSVSIETGSIKKGEKSSAVIAVDDARHRRNEERISDMSWQMKVDHQSIELLQETTAELERKLTESEERQEILSREIEGMKVTQKRTANVVIVMALAMCGMFLSSRKFR